MHSLRLVYLIIFYFIISCETEGNEIINSEVEITKLTFIEGYQKIGNTKTNEFQEGYYLNGFKDGLWKYNINGDKWVKDWSIYEGVEDMTISIPLDWKILDDKMVHFSAKGEVSNTDTAQVIMYIRTIPDSLDNFNTHSYRDEYVEDLKEKYAILEESEQCFINSGDSFLVSKFHLGTNGKEYYCFTLFDKMKDKIIEVSYYFKSTNWNNHYNMFFDFVNGVKLNDSFITNHNIDEHDPMGFVYCDEDSIQ